MNAGFLLADSLPQSPMARYLDVINLKSLLIVDFLPFYPRWKKSKILWRNITAKKKNKNFEKNLHLEILKSIQSPILEWQPEISIGYFDSIHFRPFSVLNSTPAPIRFFHNLGVLVDFEQFWPVFVIIYFRRSWDKSKPKSQTSENHKD